MTGHWITAAFAAAIAAMAPGARAQSGADFYKGRTVTLLVGSSPGGGYDTLGRAVSRFLGKHIAGNPVIVVQNMSGAGGIIPANHLFKIAARDGTVIGMVNNTTPFEPLIGTKEAAYDPNLFNWLGTPSVEVGLVSVWRDSPIKSLEDLKSRESTMGSSGANSTPSFYARLLNELIGAKMKIVVGYPGLNEAFLAMERGEIDGFPSAFYSALTSTRPDWLRDKKVRIIIQYGPRKQPELGAVPFLPDLLTTPQDKSLAQVAFAALAAGRPFLMPPGVPPDRVAVMRKALMDVFADREFLDEAEKLQLSAGSVRTGAQLQEQIAEAYRSPPQLTARLRRLAGQGSAP